MPQPSVDRRRFHLDTCVGRGGFGEVYRATLVTSGGVRSEVAVKVLLGTVDPRSQPVQRLRDEGRVLGAIRHPCVLSVYDLVLLDGRVALVSEYVDGEDLEAVYKSGEPIPPRTLLTITGKVADALNAAFRAPTADGELALVHRDIKPANIRLGRHGEVKLLDFGIARAGQGPREAATEPGELVGTYRYMAPERLIDRYEASDRSDVYSLGLTLYEGLAGKRAFGEMPVADRFRLALDEPKYDRHLRQSLDLLRNELPREVVSLLYQMLDLAPASRPDHETVARTCHRLADDLPGVTLDQWARERDWAEPLSVGGSLDGAVIAETLFSEVVPEPVAVGRVPPRGVPPRAIAAFGVGTACLGLLMLLIAAWVGHARKPAPAPPVAVLAPLTAAMTQGEGMANRGWGIVAGDPVTALYYFDRAVAVEPNFARGHHGRGAALIRLGRDEEALRALCLARRLGSRDTVRDVEALLYSTGLRCP